VSEARSSHVVFRILTYFLRIFIVRCSSLRLRFTIALFHPATAAATAVVASCSSSAGIAASPFGAAPISFSRKPSIRPLSAPSVFSPHCAPLLLFVVGLLISSILQLRERGKWKGDENDVHTCGPILLSFSSLLLLEGILRASATVFGMEEGSSWPVTAMHIKD
jgi:hypothetical protein